MEEITIAENKRTIRAEYKNGSYVEMKAGLFSVKYVKSSGLTDDQVWELAEIIVDYLEEKRFNQKVFGLTDGHK